MLPVVHLLESSRMHSRFAGPFTLFAALGLLVPALGAQQPHPVATKPAGPTTVADAVNLTGLTVTRANVRGLKKQAIAKALSLPDSEAKVFWPLYDDYEEDMAELWDRRIALVSQYADSRGSLDPDRLRALFNAVFDLDSARLSVRRGQYEKFAEVLPIRTVARFFEIDIYLERLIDAKAWGQLPEVR
jgi:hypothetical protein